MPTYEYKCLECDHRFEVFQSMTDDPLTDCVVCDGKVKRLIGTGAGIIFKGSGFYCTDYRSDSYQSAAKADSTSPSPSASATETKKKEAGSESKAVTEKSAND